MMGLRFYHFQVWRAWADTGYHSKSYNTAQMFVECVWMSEHYRKKGERGRSGSKEENLQDNLSVLFMASFARVGTYCTKCSLPREYDRSMYVIVDDLET